MDHPIHKIRPIPFHTHLSTNQTQAIVALRQRPMPEVMTGGTGGGGGSLDCRSFWKAGANEGPSAPIREFHDGLETGDFDRARVHPKFLHTNATSHKWAFGAISELLDNAVDEICNGATFVKVDKSINSKDNSPMLVFQDDGGGMDPEGVRKCMSLGFSTKKTKTTIGQYGNGFKTSTMRLGADAVVFTRAMRESNVTLSIGLLSYTFLRRTMKDDIVVPMLDFEVRDGHIVPLVYGSQGDWDSSLKIILDWSPFSSKEELLKQFADVDSHGTKVVIYNLWMNDDGLLELDFEDDDEDILLREGQSTGGTTKIQKEIVEQHVSHRLRFSLRAYTSILYLRKFENFQIILRGKPVEQISIANELKFKKVVTYKPQVAHDSQVVSVKVDIGFAKEAPVLGIFGMNVYHKNRLIMQNTTSSAGILPPLSGTFCNQSFFNNGTNQDANRRNDADASGPFQAAIDVFQKSCARLEAASEKLEQAAEAMKDMMKYMKEKDAAEQERAGMLNVNDLELRLGRNPRQAEDQTGSHNPNKYERAKRPAKNFAMWVAETATPEELVGSWVQFSDGPRCGVNGVYLRKWLNKEADVSDLLGFALARLLKRGEDRDAAKPTERVHYVLHDWADKAMTCGSSTEECVYLFDRHKRKYKMTECTKIVPFIYHEGQWLSLTVDIVNRSTLLIHPTRSSTPPAVLDVEYRPLMQRLTFMAISNMNVLNQIPANGLSPGSAYTDIWTYGVALQQEHPIEPNNAGAVTFFYSIPKEHQFMIVSGLTIHNTKQTFVHELVKMCNHLTGKRVMKKKEKVKVIKGKKRNADGKFAKGMGSSSGESSDDSVDGSRAPSSSMNELED